MGGEGEKSSTAQPGQLAILSIAVCWMRLCAALRRLLANRARACNQRSVIRIYPPAPIGAVRKTMKSRPAPASGKRIHSGLRSGADRFEVDRPLQGPGLHLVISPVFPQAEPD